MEYLTPLSFLIISFIYSSVGLGGGSSYTAIMAITGVSYHIIPSVSLTLNLLVTFFGMVNFWRFGYVRYSLVIPFILTSVPLAYFAGSIKLNESIFEFILLLSLIAIATRIYILNDLVLSIQLTKIQKWSLIIFIGSSLGFVAGAIGIGGGIYLIPLIIMLGLGTEKEAAAAGSIFVWSNSLAGLAPRYQLLRFEYDVLLPSILSVLIGGSLGSYFGATKYDPQTIQKVMGIVIILAILFLMRKIF